MYVSTFSHIMISPLIIFENKCAEWRSGKHIGIGGSWIPASVASLAPQRQAAQY